MIAHRVVSITLEGFIQGVVYAILVITAVQRLLTQLDRSGLVVHEVNYFAEPTYLHFGLLIKKIRSRVRYFIISKLIS
jgi:hypothetical protein